MKKVIAVIMVALVAVAAQAADVSAYVDFASAYVFRGATLNNGPVLQPGIEVSGFPIPEENGSLAVGIWANYDLDDEDGEGSDISEIDYYLTYSLPVELMDVSLTYTEYDYPNNTDNNDREVTLSLGSPVGTNGLYAGVSFNYGLDGAIEDDLYIQGSLDFETEISDALSASAGVTLSYLMDDDEEEGFNDATASVGLGYTIDENWSVGAGLTYIAQLDDDVLDDDEYDVALVGSVGVSCDF